MNGRYCFMGFSGIERAKVNRTADNISASIPRKEMKQPLCECAFLSFFVVFDCFLTEQKE